MILFKRKLPIPVGTEVFCLSTDKFYTGCSESNADTTANSRDDNINKKKQHKMINSSFCNKAHAYVHARGGTHTIS